MKINRSCPALFLLVMCLFCCFGTGCSRSFVRVTNPASDPKINEFSNEYFKGIVELSGQYEALQDGELCFVPESKYSTLFPYGKQRVCFTNEERAEQLFGVSAAISTIDAKKICGVCGDGRIVVSGLITGMEDASRWYVTTLLSVLVKEPFVYLN